MKCACEGKVQPGRVSEVMRANDMMMATRKLRSRDEKL